MKANARAKRIPQLILLIPIAIAWWLPPMLGLPSSVALVAVAAFVNLVASVAISGGQAKPSAGIGYAPAYWVPATIWTGAVAVAAAAPAVDGGTPGNVVRWLAVGLGGLQALCDLGCRIKDR